MTALVRTVAAAVTTVAAVLLLAAVSVGPSVEAAIAVERGEDPPAWAMRRSTCAVDFTRTHSSEALGFNGYSAYVLVTVDRRGVSCSRARRLARRHWVQHPGSELLRWRSLRTWRTTSGGSAWVGNYRGQRKEQRVEYLAIH